MMLRAKAIIEDTQKPRQSTMSKAFAKIRDLDVTANGRLVKENPWRLYGCFQQSELSKHVSLE